MPITIELHETAPIYPGKFRAGENNSSVLMRIKKQPILKITINQ